MTVGMTLSTILPILVLGALGFAVPVVVMRFMPDTLRGLAVGVMLSVVLLTLFGSALFVWLYAEGVGLGVILDPAGLVHFWGLGVRAALVWLPILALTALGLGQGIERRRGERMAARDMD